MTREEAKQMLPIIKAYSEGEIIEWRSSNFNKWEEQGEDCVFEFSPKTYRIKPEPKYRPFANAEECWNEMLKHQPFGWCKTEDGNYYPITSVDSSDDFNSSFNSFKFADGAPFGVKVEEE